MKRITATVILLTAISAPALAETPTQRELHSWDYVQQVATSSQAPAEAPAVEQRHEQHQYYHHEAGHEGKKHHGKHHEGKKHHGGKKHHHHHHHADKTESKGTDKPAEQPKQ